MFMVPTASISAYWPNTVLWGSRFICCSSASCFVTLGQMAKQAKFDGDQTLMNYTNMFRFSIIGFLVSGFFLGRAYFDYFFTIVACMVILDRLARSSTQNPEPVIEAVEQGCLLPDSTPSLQRG